MLAPWRATRSHIGSTEVSSHSVVTCEEGSLWVTRVHTNWLSCYGAYCLATYRFFATDESVICWFEAFFEIISG